MSVFHFKRFDVINEQSPMKVGTDGVLLGAVMSISGRERNLLDIGTGTGVIALMAAQRLSGILAEGDPWQITGIDIDSASSSEARTNFSSSPWSAHLQSENVRLQEYVPSSPLDLIFTNPPFYDGSLTNPDARLAAARHTEGLSHSEILAFASEHLTDGGTLALILPAECERSLTRTAASFALVQRRIVRIKTTPSKPVRRIIVEFTKGGRPGTRFSEEELCVSDSARYTGDFYLDK